MVLQINAPRRRKQTSGRTLLGFFLLSLLILALFTLDFGLRLLSAPWSIGTGGRPTMTGDWLGKIVLDDGTTGALFMSLNYNFSETQGYGANNLQGDAYYCLGDYTAYMEVYGTADRSGTITELRFRPMEDDPVWLVNNASGSWRGETLTINATYSFDPTAVHIFRSDQPSPPLTLVFHPGNKESYEANCAAS